MARPVSKPCPYPEGLLPGANFGDTYSLVVNGLKLDALGASQLVFGRTPGWIKWLLALRNLIVKPFGLKSGRERALASPHVGFFPVIRHSTHRVLLGLDDRHLNFRVSVDVQDCGAGWQEISVSTAVKTHNLLGRVYLAMVKPFHRMIVPAMLMQVDSGPSRTDPAKPA